jgi:carbon storage regulator
MSAAGDPPVMGRTPGATGIVRLRGIGFASLLAVDRSSGHHGQQGGIGAMLVLTRKSNQSIMIGDDIEVSVLAIMGEKVRIGIQAPRDVPVFRREVYLEIQEERAAGDGAREEVDAALRDLGTTES